MHLNREQRHRRKRMTKRGQYSRLHSQRGRTLHQSGVQCNGVYKILLTKILSGYNFTGTRTSGGYPTPVYSILLNIATKLELQN